VRKVFSTSTDGTARAIARFASTRKKRLIHPWPAFLLFAALAIARRVIPGLLQGRKTLAGEARRRG
jgi:hypothetical protein